MPAVIIMTMTWQDIFDWLNSAWQVLQAVLPLVTAAATLVLAIAVYKLSKAANQRSSLYQARLDILLRLAPVVEQLYVLLPVMYNTNLAAIVNESKADEFLDDKSFLQVKKTWAEALQQLNRELPSGSLILDDMTLKALMKIKGGAFRYLVLVPASSESSLKHRDAMVSDGVKSFRINARKLVGTDELGAQLAAALDRREENNGNDVGSRTAHNQ